MACSETIFEVLTGQKIRCRYCDSTDLMKRDHDKPELIMALYNNHYTVTLLDAEIHKIIGCLVGIVVHITEGETTLFSKTGQMYHGNLFRTFLCEDIHNIEAEVEVVIVLKIYF